MEGELFARLFFVFNSSTSLTSRPLEQVARRDSARQQSVGRVCVEFGSCEQEVVERQCNSLCSSAILTEVAAMAAYIPAFSRPHCDWAFTFTFVFRFFFYGLFGFVVEYLFKMENSCLGMDSNTICDMFGIFQISAKYWALDFYVMTF